MYVLLVMALLKTNYLFKIAPRHFEQEIEWRVMVDD